MVLLKEYTAFNIATDSFEGITGLNESTIDALETLGMSATYADVFWANVVRVPRDFAPQAQGRNFH